MKNFDVCHCERQRSNLTQIAALTLAMTTNQLN